LVFIDLDQFKYVNDTYGHHFGDQYLNAVAKLLIANLRTTDILARWAGMNLSYSCPKQSVPRRISSQQAANCI